MDVNKETRDRIVAAADRLYEQAGRANFPTVDAVRKVAQVNMNDASTCMKDWRRAQTAQAAPVAIAVPEAVQQLHGQALASLWQSAQELANESLRAAQAGWEAERAEADALNQQVVDAHVAQQTELEAVAQRIDELTRAHAQQQQRADTLAGQLEETRNAKIAAESRAAIAEQRAEEITRRADDLKIELGLSHADADAARAQHQQDAQVLRAEKAKAEAEVEESVAALEELRNQVATLKAKAEAAAQAQQDQKKAAAAEALRIAERLTKAQTERDEAQRSAAQAREEAAELRGQADAIKEQNAKLMQSVQTSKAVGEASTPKGRKE